MKKCGSICNNWTVCSSGKQHRSVKQSFDEAYFRENASHRSRTRLEASSSLESVQVLISASLAQVCSRPHTYTKDNIAPCESPWSCPSVWNGVPRADSATMLHMGYMSMHLSVLSWRVLHSKQCICSLTTSRITEATQLYFAKAQRFL